VESQSWQGTGNFLLGEAYLPRYFLDILRNTRTELGLASLYSHHPDMEVTQELFPHETDIFHAGGNTLVLDHRLPAVLFVSSTRKNSPLRKKLLTRGGQELHATHQVHLMET
jgi:hypothetical protein